MAWRKLVRSAGFRFALLYTVAFVLSVAVLGVLIEVAVSSALREQARARIDHEIGALTDEFAHGGRVDLEAALVGRFSSDWPTHKVEGWASVAFLLAFIFIFGCSWGPVGWAMPAEVFPSSLRAKGVATAVCLNWVANFIIVSLTDPHRTPLPS